MSTRLFVGNLSYQTTEEDLRQLFAGAATVASVTLVTERDSGRSKGFAFVEMANQADVQPAIDALNGREVGGRALTVNEAREQAPRGGGFGGGGRGGGGGRSRY